MRCDVEEGELLSANSGPTSCDQMQNNQRRERSHLQCTCFSDNYNSNIFFSAKVSQNILYNELRSVNGGSHLLFVFDVFGVLIKQLFPQLEAQSTSQDLGWWCQSQSKTTKRTKTTLREIWKKRLVNLYHSVGKKKTFNIHSTIPQVSLLGLLLCFIIIFDVRGGRTISDLMWNKYLWARLCFCVYTCRLMRTDGARGRQTELFSSLLSLEV